MDKIEEIKKLINLLEQGAITEEEFKSLKQQVIDFDVDYSDSNETKNVGKNKIIGEYIRVRSKLDELKIRTREFFNKPLIPSDLKKKSTLTRVLLAIPLLIIITLSLVFGQDDGSFLTTFLITTLFSGFILLLFLLLRKIIPALLAVVVTFLIPIIAISFLLAGINLFSSFTYNPKIKKVTNYQTRSSDYKEIPQEVFYVRIEGDSENYNEKTMVGTYRSYDENGKLVTYGNYKEGVRVGNWFMAFNDELSIKLSYDKSATVSSIENYENNLFENNRNNESWSNDISLNNKNWLSQNGSIANYNNNYELGGIAHGEIKVYYKDNLYITGQVEKGFLNGQFNFYNPKGKVYKSIFYEKGKPLNLEWFQENISMERIEENLSGDRKIITGLLFNGNYHGEFKIYDEHGGVVLEGNYVDGNEHGEIRNYGRFCGPYDQNCTYQIQAKVDYYNGHKHGLFTSFWSDVATSYNVSGSYAPEIGDVINYTVNYSYGKKHGTYTKYDGSRTRRVRGVWYTKEYREGEEIEDSTRYY